MAIQNGNEKKVQAGLLWTRKNGNMSLEQRFYLARRRGENEREGGE